MKKRELYNKVLLPKFSTKKLLLMLNWTITLTFLLVLEASASSYAQNLKVDLDFQNVKFKRALSIIEQKGNIRLLYSEQNLPKDKTITLSVKDTPVMDALGMILKDTNLGFRVLENGLVVISPQKSEVKDIKVSGTITDSKGETLPGVSIKIKGTAIGATTDLEGRYTINVPDDISVLVFTYIGYVTQEIPVNGLTSINVILQASNTELNEVVVTSFGVTKQKRGLGYSIQEVGGELFTDSRMNNVATSLSGKIAGVDAVQVNGGAGASSRVIIRGNTSLNGNQQPLYILDGVPISNNNREPATDGRELIVDRGDGISAINPDDIATITILKGGAAAALYGSQAATGVILITTKKGSLQKGVGIELTSDSNIGSPYIFPNFQQEYGQGNDGVKPATFAASIGSGRLAYGAKMDGSMVVQFDGVARPYSPVKVKDNILNFYQASRNMTNSIAFNTGTEKLKMRLSISDLKANDLQPNSTYKRKTGNLNVTSKMGKNDFITIESGVQYNLTQGTNRPISGFVYQNPAWAAYLSPNVVDIRNMRGTDPDRPGINVATGNELPWNPVTQINNPYFLINYIGNEDKEQRVIGRTSIQADLLKNLFVKGTVSRDFSYYNESNFMPMTNVFNPEGYFNSGKQQFDKTNFNAIVNYNERYLKDHLGLNLMIGANKERDYIERSNANGSKWVVPNFYNLSNLVNKDPINSTVLSTGTNSVFGEVNLDYKNIIYLTVTGRNDWFSVLNPGFNSIFYPSVGASIILSDVIKMPDFLNYAKLRSSWAEVGSATVSAGSINEVYTINTLNAYGTPLLSNPSILSNPNIRPATATTVEGGFETRMFKNRIALDVNYYSRRTKNDILSPPITPATGFTAGRRNMGLITNRGYEISLTGAAISRKDFSWDVNYNFSYNESKIVALAPGIDVLALPFSVGNVQIINAVGLPYSTLRANVMKRDANGTLVYNKNTGYEDRVLQDMGVGNPPYLMGLGNTFRYKRFSLRVDIDSKFGAVAYNYMGTWSARLGLNPKTLPGREAGLTVTGVDQTGLPYSRVWPVVDLDTYYNNFGNSYAGMWVYKTDFIKLRRAVLKYQLPKNLSLTSLVIRRLLLV